MAEPSKATFGKPVAAAAPHEVAAEIFEDLCDRLRRAVQAAARLGDREAGLDLVTMERDLHELSREFGGALFDLGADTEMRAEQVERAKTEVANLRQGVRELESAISKAEMLVAALR